jgi:hypothetical protein
MNSTFEHAKVIRGAAAIAQILDLVAAPGNDAIPTLAKIAPGSSPGQALRTNTSCNIY